MGEMKPTRGPWDLWGDANPSQVISSPAGFVAQTLGSNDEANARLIAEAGTVFHNTGLSPVQLVEMVKELKAALCLMVRTHDEPAENLLQEVKEQQWLDKARAALAKCEGVGNG